MQVAPADWPDSSPACGDEERGWPDRDGAAQIRCFAACDAVTERAALPADGQHHPQVPDGRFLGDMFDGIGFVEACRENGCDFAGKRALLIGPRGGHGDRPCGRGCRVARLAIADIDTARRDELAERLLRAGFPAVAADADPAEADIVLNATPLGMRADDPPPAPFERLRPGNSSGMS